MLTPPTKRENRSCLTKVKYHLREEAKQSAKMMRQKFREKNIKAYRCEYCDAWHVGHSRK